MGRPTVWVLLGLTLLAVSLHEVQVGAEVGPSETECRPYIEKAIHDLQTGETLDKNPESDNGLSSTELVDENNSNNDDGIESTEDSGQDDNQNGSIQDSETPLVDINDSVEVEDNKSEETAENDDNEREKRSLENNLSEEQNDDQEKNESAEEEQTGGEDGNQSEEQQGNDKSNEQDDNQSEENKEQSDEQGNTTESKEVDESQEANDIVPTEENEQEVDNNQENENEEQDDKSGEGDDSSAEQEPLEDDTARPDSTENDNKSEEADTQDNETNEESDENKDQTDDASVEDEQQQEDNESTENEENVNAEINTSNENVENPSDEQPDVESDENNSKEKVNDGDDSQEEGAVNDNDSVEERVERSIVDNSETQTEVSNEEPSSENTNEETDDLPAEEESNESEEQPQADDAEEQADDTEEASSEDNDASSNEEQEKSNEESAENVEEAKDESKEDLVKEKEVVVDETQALTTSEEAHPEDDLLMEYHIPDNLRDRSHIAELLHLDNQSLDKENALNKVADVILRDLKRIYETSIKPLETLYKYRDLSNRHFGDPEIFSKPLILFMGPWSGGKSTILNYLSDNEYTPNSIRSGAEPSPAYFNILMHGDVPEVLDGTQLAADWTFSGLQKFGQGLEDRLRGLKLPSKLLEKVNIVEIPGILEVRKQVSRLFPFNDACQWFIDRADIIFLVYDPSKLDVGPETEAILDQLKGREYQTRIILNKADQVKPEELMRVQSALIWNISPLMSSAQPPVMYTTSLWSNPYETGAPVRLLQAQERAFLRDLRSAIDKRIENKIASARRFAVRVRNHAKMVDCYLTTYYNHKSLFGNKKQIADQIIEHPQNYHIYEGLSTLTNISRYDLPDPEVYRDFFRLNPLYEFKKLSETCTYFRGCPINKLDISIAYDLPEIVGKYKKALEVAFNALENDTVNDKS